MLSAIIFFAFFITIAAASLWPLILAIIIYIKVDARWWAKNVAALLIIMCIYGPPYIEIQKKNQPLWDKFQESLSIFHERCNTAEEKIYQTADNVEGILFLEMRSFISNRDLAKKDRHWPDAALPDDLVEGGDYIKSLVRDEYSNTESFGKELFLNATSVNQKNAMPGFYDYVDVSKTTGIARFDYRGTFLNSVRRRYMSSKNSSRYAVSYRNIVDPKDREHWVSGVTVSIIDTKDNSLMAEKTWYTFNYAEAIESLHSGGANYRFKDHTLSCSSTKKANVEYLYGATRFFISSVLKPKNSADKIKTSGRISSFLPNPPHFRSLLSPKMNFGIVLPAVAYLMFLFTLCTHIFLGSLKWWQKCLASIAALLVFISPFHSVYPVKSMIQEIKNIELFQPML